MPILFAFNAVPASARIGAFSECLTPQVASAIGTPLAHAGLDLVPCNLYSPRDLVQTLSAHPDIEIALVLAEGYLKFPFTLHNGTGPAHIRRMLRALGKSFSHSGPEAMTVLRHKDITYQVLSQVGIRVPFYFKVGASRAGTSWMGDLPPTHWLPFPLFVKPAGGGASVGIDSQSIVYTPEELEQQVTKVSQCLKADIIVEEYLPGREYTIGVVGNERPTVLPVLAFPPHYPIRTTEIKRSEHEQRDLFEVITSSHALYAPLASLAETVFRTVGAQDCIRIDLKEDQEGRPVVIDVNGTPALAPTSSLAFVASAAGLSYSELINLVCGEALLRNQMDPPLEMAAILSAAYAKLETYRQQVA